MAGFENIGATLLNPLIEIWNGFVLSLPGIVAAILILVLGYLIGALLGAIVKSILVKTKVCTLLVKKMDLNKDVKKWNFPSFFGLIVKWYVFIVFLTPAAGQVTFNGLSRFFLAVALWIPNIILAIIIVMVGYILAEYIAQKIRETRAVKKSLMASIAKVIVWIFVILIALRKIGIDITVAENTFLIILAGVMLGVALAFGLGFKDDAKGLLKKLKKRI